MSKSRSGYLQLQPQKPLVLFLLMTAFLVQLSSAQPLGENTLTMWLAPSLWASQVTPNPERRFESFSR